MCVCAVVYVNAYTSRHESVWMDGWTCVYGCELTIGMYICICVCVYICISIQGPGHICVGVLSVCWVVCILYVNHSSTFPGGDGQIKMEQRLKILQFHYTLFRMIWRHTVWQYFMPSVLAATRPEVGNIDPYIYTSIELVRGIRQGRPEKMIGVRMRSESSDTLRGLVIC